MNRMPGRTIIFAIERALALLIVVSVLLDANGSRMTYGLENFLLQRITILHVLFAICFLMTWTICFQKSVMEPESYTRAKMLWTTIRGVLCVTAILAISLVVSGATTPLVSVVPQVALLSLILVTTRLLVLWMIENSPWTRPNYVLILGTGAIARKAWREIRTKHHRSMKVIGFVDDECMDIGSPEIQANYLCKVEDLESLLLSKVVDLIVIALPAKSCYSSIQKAISIAEDMGVDFVQHESVFQMKTSIHNAVSIEHRQYAMRHSERLLERISKRVIDITVSGIALIVLLPLFLVIACAIKLTSEGPALFIQKRYGYRRRQFRLFKFRTMVVNAEQLIASLEQLNEADGPLFKMKDDPRVTRIGRFLRRTSLDELPQLWNVFIGNMSLVGPRPMSIRDVSLFSNAYLMRRFRVKPGITGLWQVTGRSNTSFAHWIAMDFRYIDHWSLWLDFEILLRTIPVVLKGSGAV